jgi:hypothetical protein
MRSYRPVSLAVRAVLVTVVFAAVAEGRILYVSAGSSAGGNGSEQSPYTTIQAAADITIPGDTVYVGNGTYGTDKTGYTEVVLITRGGTSDSWIRYMARPGHSPLIHFECFSGIKIRGASYIEVSGFEVRGDLAGHTLDYAIAHQNDDIASLDNDGISIGPGGSWNAPVAPYPAHILVRGNHVHHCAGSGIGMYLSDYITVDSNRVHSCCWWTPWAKSGINMGWAYNSDSNTGYKIVVTRNVVYDCETYIMWRSVGRYSDGNGFIFDSFDQYDRPAFDTYTGRTLVANNVAFDNGGSGMHAFHSAHIDFVNNTAYLNSRSPHLEYASLGAWQCTDARVLNNVVYVRPGEPVNSDYNIVDVLYDHNVYFGGDAPVVSGPRDTVADPQFVAASVDFATADFSLQSTSPAIDRGRADIAPTTDIAGTPRPQGNGVDAGAYEYDAATACHGMGSPAAKPARAQRCRTGVRMSDHTGDAAAVEVMNSEGAGRASRSDLMGRLRLLTR